MLKKFICVIILVVICALNITLSVFSQEIVTDSSDLVITEDESASLIGSQIEVIYNEEGQVLTWSQPDPDTSSVLSTTAELPYETYYLDSPLYENSVMVKKYLVEFSDDYKISENQKYLDQYPQISLVIDLPTTKYNCHSYAWYSQNYGGNIYWMPSPEQYYLEGSYVPSTGQVGDIICYFNQAGENLHSGIVVERRSGTSNGVCGDSDLVVVQSKWGGKGLYEHPGDRCPYTTLCYGYSDMSDAEKQETIASYVVYYRRVNHTHTFEYTSCSIANRHKKYCTGCNVTIWEEHFESSYVSVSTDIHNIYCACGHLMESEAHSYSVKNVGDDFKHAMQCACGHISSYIDHTFSYTESDASTHTKYCTVCYHEVIEPHFGEIINAVNNGTTHTLTCECSQTVTEAHSYNSCVPLDDELHKDTCICGSYITGEHNLVATSMDTAYHKVSCEECGYEVESTHTFGYTSLGTQNHRKTCTVCGDFYDEDHILNIVVEYDAAEHTVKCICNYQITQGHIRMDYTATTHTGECRVCDHVSSVTEAHTLTYTDNGDGLHTVSCTGCEYSVTELHDCVYTPIDIHGHDAVCQYCSYEVEDEAHSWDDGYDAEGNQYNYCMQCGYESDYIPMTAEMIAALSIEEQQALIQSIKTSTSDFILYLDAERGVLYQDGVCYLFYVPANVEVSVYLQPIDLATTQPVYPLPEVTE